jgi:DNA-binding NarL/FixJ family response regulator
MTPLLMKPKRFTVLIADDHPVFRSGLVQIIAADAEFESPRQASDGEQALQLLRQYRPHVAALDIEMPRLNGLAVARAAQRERLPTALCLVTAYKDSGLFDEAMDLGIKGYVLKESAAADILNAVKTVAAGGFFISPVLAQLLVQRQRRARELGQRKPGLESLTPRERRILKMISVDKTTKEIASELDLSPRTVENHRAHIAAKLDLHGAHSLLKFAFGHRDQLL